MTFSDLQGKSQTELDELFKRSPAGPIPDGDSQGEAIICPGTYWSRIFAPVMGRPPGHGPFGGLPATMKQVEPALDKCLRERPALERTRPPAGGQVVK